MPASHAPSWTISREKFKLIQQLKTRKPEESDTVAEEKHKDENSSASLQYASVNKLIIYTTMHR